MRGTVKWFDDAKGFGFIQADDPDVGDDVFVHQSSIVMTGRRTLTEGQHVTFDLTQGPKGLQARNIHPA